MFERPSIEGGDLGPNQAQSAPLGFSERSVCVQADGASGPGGDARAGSARQLSADELCR